MKLTVSHPPHIKKGVTVKTLMWSRIGILIPAILLSIYVFGLPALGVVLASVLSAVITEAGIQKIFKQKSTIKDGDTILIGLIIALLLPPDIKLWIPVIGAFFGVALVKHAFGGLGSTLFNPAIAAWIFMNMSWGPLTVPNSVPHLAQYSDLILELGAGRLADVSPIVFILGGGYLIYKNYIDWRIPSAYLITTVAFAFIIGEEMSFVITGMLFFGVFILATDTVTSPITKSGRIIYGILCGILTVIYGYFSFNYVIAVPYAILLANAVAPLIEKNTFPKPIDEVTA